jgi:calcium-dependent protein kinase
MLMISSQYTSQKDRQKLQEVFTSVDENKDGRLSRDELLNGWVAVFGGTVSEAEIDAIMIAVDSDKSGYVDFDEFISAAV